MLADFNNSYKKSLIYSNANKNYKKSDSFNFDFDITQSNLNNIEIDNTSNFEFILKNIYKNKIKQNNNLDFHQFEKISLEINEFRFKLFEMIKNHKFTINPNFSSSHVKTIIDFKKKKPFVIVELDKNMGAGLITHEIHKYLIDSQLNNSLVYKQLPDNPLSVVTREITEVLEHLRDTKSMSKRLFNTLKPFNSVLGKFRILPKIHKFKFDCRPIVNCKNTPTANLALFIELILRKYVQNSPSYVKDSTDLIKQCKDLNIDKNYKLYSCDFSALYTNIPSNKCLNVICDFIKTKNELFNSDFNMISFREILKMVLFKNIFECNNKFYIQIKGISMGVICGPTIANLYLSLLENSLTTIEKPLLYKRYIDDIFIIIDRTIDQKFFQEYFPDLSISICSNDEVIYITINFYRKYLDKW
jgi:hypothetical protein